MNKVRIAFVLAVLLLVLPACLAAGGAPATPTLITLPTDPAVSPTVALPTLPPVTLPPATLPAPSATAPQPTVAAPTVAAPTAAAPTQNAPPAATATGAPRAEAIAILQPGPGSRVVSPLRLSGMADPTFEQSLSVTILLADGTPIATGFTQIGADIGQRGPYSLELPFSVAQEQQGFIQVYATSAKDGGVTHLSSVGVTLAPGGTANSILAAEQPERIIIHQPQNGAAISGGVLRVEGFGLASFEQTLVIDILDEEGNPLASAPVTVSAPDLGQPGPFSADLTYSIPAETSGRVQVRDISPAHGGNAHLSSVEVRLAP